MARSRPNRPVSPHRRFLFNPRCGLRSKTGPNPTDRARPGSTHHLTTGSQGIPLAVILTGANRNDVTQLQALVGYPAYQRQAWPTTIEAPGRSGRQRLRPRQISTSTTRESVSLSYAAGIATEIARRGQPHGSGLCKTRWVVERTISWLHNFRRLRIRFERLAFIHEAFMKIACCIISINVGMFVGRSAATQVQPGTNRPKKMSS
ncbi:transposase [Caballeronia zhejiangensis]|uniref:transposase n=1 Tax=Caballeronia zhejiangensis TaxID=871203 RepID=UPI003CC7F743